MAIRPLVQLPMITPQRRDEVAHMARAGFDIDNRLWTLLRELTKADRAHEVPLSGSGAGDYRNPLPRVGEGLVFPANRARSKNPASGFSKAKARIDEAVARHRASAAGHDPKEVKLQD